MLRHSQQVPVSSRPSWQTRRQRLRPASLLLTLLWQVELLIPNDRLAWRCYGLRELLMERSCLFCRRFDSEQALNSLSFGDYAHPGCSDEHRDEWARRAYPLLFSDSA